MLVGSHRHRAEDLRLWAELEAADRVNGARPRLAEKVEVSLHAIACFAADGPCYASVSWGKDSTVLAHLVWRLRGAAPIPLLHVVARPVANPDADLVRDDFSTKCPGLDYRESIITYDRVLFDGRTNAEDGKKFFAAFSAAGDRHISGIRADESGARRIRMRRHGLASVNACAPLGWWTDADCFGYLACHSLPVHPAYAMLGGGRWDRRNLRVDELAGVGGNNYGRTEWEKEYYGDVLRRIQASSGTTISRNCSGCQ